MAKRKPKRQRGNGPYLDAALICEDLIQETDGAISAIRAVNKITAHEITPKPGDLFFLPLALLISFKAGGITDTFDLSVHVISPSGKRSPLCNFSQPHTLAFEGGDTGVVRGIPLSLKYEMDGTYWIEVVLDGKRYSCVPLTFLTGRPPKEERA